MPTSTTVIPVVTICDLNGVLMWTNHPNPDYIPGVLVWDYASDEHRELLMDRVSRAVFMKEAQEFDAATDTGERYHVWIWPVMTDNVGVCLVGIRLPDEIALLTVRERECLHQLALGRKTTKIAKEFDVSVSTVHTYMKRAREKLHLSTMEQLIAYASRHLSSPAIKTPKSTKKPNA